MLTGQELADETGVRPVAGQAQGAAGTDRYQFEMVAALQRQLELEVDRRISHQGIQI